MKSKKIKKAESPVRPDPMWGTVAALYHELGDLTPAEREKRLNALGKRGAAVRREVERLLAASTSISRFLENPIGPRAALALRSPNALNDGQLIDDFRIVRELGSGSFATVYLAQQKSLDRLVALKVSPDVGSEARLMASLEHDHIVKIYSETRAKRLRLVAMQYVPGASLERLLAAMAPLPADKRTGRAALDLLETLCRDDVPPDSTAMADREELAATTGTEAVLWLGTRLGVALAHAHEKGVLHLDVKPSNVLISRYGRPMLTDFNVSRDARTAANTFGGTLAYMAPEQQAVFRAEDRAAAIAALDGRADIHALGLVLHESLGDTRDNPDVRHVLTRAANPDRDRRYPNATAFVQALRSCLDLSAIRRELPKSDWLTWLSSSRPLLAVTLLGAIPQLLASYVGTTYNSLRIVKGLTPAQQAVFHSVSATYSPVLYLVATVLWLWGISRLVPYLRASADLAYDTKLVEERRLEVLRLPYLGIAITSLGWLPGAILFPLVIQQKAGPIAASAIGHFVVSFLLSWLIAMAYSYLIHESVVLRVLYPRFWVGATDVKRKARVELADLPKRIRFFASLTGLIPLLGAILLLSQGPGSLEPAAFKTFQSLVIALIVLGGIGVAFALNVTQKLGRTITAFGGDATVRNAA